MIRMGDTASLLSRLDARVGDGIEALVRAKHHWRLRRLGAATAIDPGDGWWAAGDPPPRAGCSLEVLIDGAEYFVALAEAIQSARRYVHIAGWHLAPYFELVRGGTPLIADPDFADWFAVCGLETVRVKLDGRSKLMARMCSDVIDLEPGLELVTCHE